MMQVRLTPFPVALIALRLLLSRCADQRVEAGEGLASDAVQQFILRPRTAMLPLQSAGSCLDTRECALKPIEHITAVIRVDHAIPSGNHPLVTDR